MTSDRGRDRQMLGLDEARSHDSTHYPHPGLGKRWRSFSDTWEATSGAERTRHAQMGSSGDDRPMVTFAGVTRAAAEGP